MKNPIKTQATEERRNFAATGLEVRSVDGEPVRLVGYAAVFGERSEDLGGFVEVIQPGAFAGSLGGDVRALFNHSQNFILGRTKAKTLFLREDPRGLMVEILPPDTEQGRGVVEAIRRGDVDQMSFGFRTIKDAWDEEKPGKWVRTLLEVRLLDVSPVVFPAYPTTEIAVRSLDAHRASLATPPDFRRENERRRLELATLD